MGSHIATNYVDAFETKLKCWYCNEVSMHRIGWVAMECSNCKMEYSLDDTAAYLVKRMRERMKFTRPQIAKLTGYSKNTVKNYEYDWCSEKYYKKVQQLFINHIKGINDVHRDKNSSAISAIKNRLKSNRR